MASSINRPELADVHQFLRKHNALIVHFSGAPKGGGIERNSRFPNDLEHVVEGRAMGGLSCSVVRPGDVFHGFERNATGCIGVVLDLQSKDSLVAVDPHDCGSIEDETTSIRKVQDEHDINLGDLERTLADRTTYNEWVVRDYVVRGIFAVEPFEVSVLEVFDLPPEVPEEFRLETPDLNIRRSSLKDVESAFPDQDVYTFKSGKILKVTADQCVPVEHDDIYRH